MSNQINEGAARYNNNTSSHFREGGDLPEFSGSQGTQSPQQLVTDHLDLWTSTVTPKSTSGRGRGSGKSSKIELTGIKKLRELILELAVRGKLVPQNPDDEPVSKLLERIEAEKAQLIKDGMLKKQKPLAAVNEDEKPFELPEGWEWVKLGVIQIFTNGFAFKSQDLSDTTSDYGVVKIGDVYRSGEIKEDKMQFIRADIARGIEEKFFIEPGDLVITMTGDVKIAFNTSEKRYLLNQRVGKIKPILVNSRYICLPLILVSDQKIKEASGGVIPNVSTEEINATEFPLPPLAEQRRIVAKVDELMALCDQLEQQSEHQLTAHQQLTDTLLATLTDSANAQELTDNWQRLANHFDLLFSGPMGAWAIDRLKDTILQLAVMGKLVPQNPDDEPAAELLKRIEEEKARLVKEGKIKKPKKLPPVSDEEKPFELPEGWEWVRFDNLIHPESVISYGVLVPGPDVDDGVPFVRIEDLSLNCPSDLPNKRISREVDSQYERTRLHGGEILMGVVGSIGKLGLAPSSWKGANIARAVCRIDPSSLISKEYIITILQSQFMQNSFAGDTRTLAQPTLNIGLIRTTVTPLPPLAEQQGIVAKVDELFALCDQLKERLQHASDIQLNLTDAIVEQALA